jgi:protein CpxP
MALMSAPTIDRVAVEALRAKRIAAIDAASKQAVAALVEAAEVLTPEQRTKLVEEMKDHKGPGRW